MLLTRRYRFAASHRLHTDSLTEEQNYRLYGKCNNPYGHGHDYVLDITVEGPMDTSGQIARRDELDELVKHRVLSELDHKNLNEDRPEFKTDVPTTENLASLVRTLLEKDWNLAPKLKAIRIAETDRNAVTLPL